MSKDFVFRLKISRKEAKESRYWLRLLKNGNLENTEIEKLIDEADQLRKIISAIIKKIE
ncbi:MAG: four helix bundle protein [Aequorivita sp.]